MGLRQGSAGATMVQSFSENVLEAQRTNKAQQLHRQAEVSGKHKLKESFYGWFKNSSGSFQGNIHSFTVNQYNEVMKQRNVLSCFLMHCFT